ncbi:hypothetical protein E3Q18_00684 [Wallemia mellicola]|nr:hypothetical protein E3Q18_00684 [Wallemia mellicola]
MSRLDKLIQIIETGSSLSIKQTAAKQIGQISKFNVGNDENYIGLDGEWVEAVRLIYKILPHLRSKNWDTRISASLAIESILKSSGTWRVDTSNSELPQVIQSNLRLLNVKDLTQNDTKLLASTGHEYTALERTNLQSAKSEAAKRLGLGFLEPDETFGFNVEDELTDQDPQGSQAASTSQQPLPPTSDTVQEAPAQDENAPGLSARERNRLKRKRKLGQPMSHPPAKIRVQEPAPQVKPEPMEDVKPSQASLVVDPAAKAAERKLQEESTQNQSKFLERPQGHYPFESVADVMQLDLLSPSWEVRHGAAAGLRELFKVQGTGGGMNVDSKIEDNLVNHTVWLENMAANVLCVLVLDRFGDFISDQVICPVRETASQTLASLVLHMSDKSSEYVHTILHSMIYQSHASTDDQSPARKGDSGFVWEVRHAGLLGLKYFVAVKKDQLAATDNEMLKKVVDAVILGLTDFDDDVRAVAAATLQPIVGLVVDTLFESVPRILDAIWDSFTQLKDDLCSSTGFVMSLLAQFIAYDSIMNLLLNPQDSTRPPLPQLISRLYPFFRHTITSVRLAVVNTLITFIETPSLPNNWVDESFLRFVYQNIVLEERNDIRTASLKLFHVAIDSIESENIPHYLFDHLQGWFAIVMTPIGLPMDSTFFLKSGGIHGQDVNQSGHNVDKNVMTQDLALVSVENILRGRYAAINALARILAEWPIESQENSFCGLIPAYIGSSYALHQQLAATLVEDWAVFSKVDSHNNTLAAMLHKQLSDVLLGDVPSTYSEMVLMLSQIRNECQVVYSSLINDGKVNKDHLPSIPAEVDPTGTIQGAFSLALAEDLMGSIYNDASSKISNRKKNALGMIDDRRKKTISTIQFYKTRKDRYDNQVYSAIAAAVVALRELPVKLNPVIRSIMNSIKTTDSNQTEDNIDLQNRAAKSLANLVELCSLPTAKANPSDKIVKNLCAFACQDEKETPIFAQNAKLREGSFTLQMEEAEQKATALAAQHSRKAIKEDKEVSPSSIIQRGAAQCILELAKKFGKDLFTKVPKLYECLSSFKNYENDVNITPEKGQEIIDSFTVLRMTVESVDASLYSELLALSAKISQAIKSNYAAIRFAAGKSLASMCKICTSDAMLRVIDEVVPLIADSSNICHRQGSVETIQHIVSTLDTDILPYVLFLIVPVLGRVSDTDDAVRKLATSTFAALVKLVPLEAGLPDPIGFPERLLAKREEERKFLTQLLDGSKVEEYEIPIKVNIDLRKYQREGISWLAFLNKYQLHGILCDDMGLGKTLQSITILASMHHERAMKHQETKSPDSRHLPSLVVCPPTLTGHWKHEILTYANNLKPLLYTGGPTERARLRKLIPRHDVVIMSYDVVRNDIADLGKVNWLYCILDEGHVIKNAKTKLTKAVKEVKAHHRLLLSGTPIQNNVLELWSLFDYLMPGFLGSEKAFNDRFGKVILASREAKASSKEQLAADNALKILHKQILPFIMRRLKEDVLNDLPPKIIQDYYCDLSDLQQQLYEEFGSSSAANEASQTVKTEEKGGQKQQHVFQALQYLRKLCNHPSLIFNQENEKHKSVIRKLESKGGNIRDVSNAPKLLALRQLLQDCGIGESGQSTDGVTDVDNGGVSQHRVLVFCQMKQMLDIVENDLFKKLMPSVSYMRMDGQTPADSRHSVVQKFNSDPSIDVLLLTTHVGGLGLNLTGADTVIFVEHDWNPQRDLQAMDRAHRLGQKKTVNVYRLITRGTLEEKIMGLQRFKLNIANSIVTQQNNSLDTMDTGQVLDLFSVSTGAEPESEDKTRKNDMPASQKNVLEGLEDLPPENEYESLDVDNFIGNL